MRISNGWSMTAVLAGFCACAGVSPRPEAVSPDRLPARELSASDVERRDAFVAECVSAAVTRRFEAAEQHARAALAIDARCARARAVLGMARLERARAEEPSDMHLTNAGDADTRLAELLAPEDPFVGWMRALFLAEIGHLSAAAAAAEAALARTSAAPPAERAPLLGIAGTYRYELGEERAALPLLQAYAGIRTDDAAASFRIGSCLLRIASAPGAIPNAELIAQNNADAAARAFQRCLVLAPGDEDAALAIGAALMRAAELADKRGDSATRDQRRAEAARQFDAACQAFPASAEAQFRRGVVAEASGDLAGAEAAWRQALALDGEHVGALLDLAASLDAAGGAEEAVALLRRVLQVDAERSVLTADERRRIAEHIQKAAAR